MKLKATPEDEQIIHKLSKRAHLLLDVNGVDAALSITAAHLNGNLLLLSELLESDNFNFTHDVTGIMSHIDTNTGKLRDSFTPRFSA